MRRSTRTWRVSNIAGAVIALLTLTSSSHGESAEPSQSGDRIIGVKIYDHKGSMPELFDRWQQLGVNTVFSSTALYSKEEFRQLARQRRLTSFIILPIFFNPDALDESEDLYAITDEGEQAREQ